MKTNMLLGGLLLGSFVLSGIASAQVEATHSKSAGTTRVVHTAVAMRHVGARTTHTEVVVVAPSAGEASKESTTVRPVRLPAVHFRH